MPVINPDDIKDIGLYFFYLLQQCFTALHAACIPYLRVFIVLYPFAGVNISHWLIIQVSIATEYSVNYPFGKIIYEVSNRLHRPTGLIGRIKPWYADEDGCQGLRLNEVYDNFKPFK